MSQRWDDIKPDVPRVAELKAGWCCPSCQLVRAEDNGPDPCLGELPGVDFACCGHGIIPDGYAGGGYIAFSNGKTIRFPTCFVDHVEKRAVNIDRVIDFFVRAIRSRR
jgi:hypothetical protein